MSNEKIAEERTLEQMRLEMDAIDQEIQAKFKERMELSAEIAKYKKAHGLPILDVEREKTKLDRIAKNVEDDLSGFTSKLYLTLSDLSKAYQAKMYELGAEEIDVTEGDEQWRSTD